MLSSVLSLPSLPLNSVLRKKKLRYLLKLRICKFPWRPTKYRHIWIEVQKFRPVETVTSEVYLNIHSSFRKQLQCSEDIKNIQTNKTTKKPWLHSKIVFVRVGNQNNQNNNRLYTFHVWKGSECSMKADESASE